MFNADDSDQELDTTLNFDNASHYFGNDKETIRQILSKVLIELELSAKKFEAYIFNESLVGIKDTAHKLVGTTSSLGLDRLCATIKKIEQQNKFDLEVLRQLLSTFKSEVKLVGKLIKSYL